MDADPDSVICGAALPAQYAPLPPTVKVAGKAFTVSVVVMIQPVGKVYVIVDVPGLVPVTTPDVDEANVAKPLLLLQVPPLVASANVVVCNEANAGCAGNACR